MGSVLHKRLCFTDQLFFMSLSDPSSILKIEKAVTSGTALVLYNIDRDVDSLFMPLIYHVTTSTSEEVEKGVTQSLVFIAVLFFILDFC